MERENGIRSLGVGFRPIRTTSNVGDLTEQPAAVVGFADPADHCHAQAANGPKSCLHIRGAWRPGDGFCYRQHGVIHAENAIWRFSKCWSWSYSQRHFERCLIHEFLSTRAFLTRFSNMTGMHTGKFVKLLCCLSTRQLKMGVALLERFFAAIALLALSFPNFG